MSFHFSTVSAIASIVALVITVLMLERWFCARPSKGGGLAEAAALTLVVWTVGSFAWLFVELQPFIEEPMTVLASTTVIFMAVVSVTIGVVRARTVRPVHLGRAPDTGARAAPMLVDAPNRTPVA